MVELEFFSFFKLILIEVCSCSPMLWFAYRKVNQPNIYIYPLSFGFPSHVGHHRTEILRTAAETKTLDGLRGCPTADSDWFT